jgi:methylenetetrahydrofolate dehydrogenase (NADP+)/methenyltetrahydrofolate cyclohydrolase
MIIDCAELKKEVNELNNKFYELIKEITPEGKKYNIHIISCNSNPASEIYMRNKMKALEDYQDILMRSIIHSDPKTGFNRLEEIIKNLKADDYHILQLPIETQYYQNDFYDLIDRIPNDIDGFNYSDIVSLVRNESDNENIIPATTRGILKAIKKGLIMQKGDKSLSGKNVLMIGRSEIVGKPTSYLLTKYDATVTLAHSKTPLNKLEKHFENADIIISAVGKPRVFGERFLKYGNKILIDVGINKTNNGICGDFDTTFEGFDNLNHFYTPVPKGIGILTVEYFVNNALRLILMNNWNRASSPEDRKRFNELIDQII